MKQVVTQEVQHAGGEESGETRVEGVSVEVEVVVEVEWSGSGVEWKW